MDEDSQAPLLDRPVRSLLDVKIGTVLKAYAVYLAIGFVIFLIGAILILTTWSHHESGGPGLGTPGSLSWDPHAGKTVTPAQFRSVRQGAALEALRNRFGDPATTSRNPLDMVDGNQQNCLDYRSSASPNALFLFCFENGRLVEKQKF
jgi:hypothetical protein